MISLYFTIANQLKSVPGLKLIDLDGTDEVKVTPAAFVNLPDINYTQLQGGNAMAAFPFSIRLELPIQARTEIKGNKTDNTEALTEGMAISEAVKNVLIKEGTQLITGIMLTGESLTKANGKYTNTFTFTGTVSYEV